MIVRRFGIGLMMVCSVTAALTGCSRSPRVTFYTLEAAAAPEAAPSGTTSISVAVGPVTLPQVVDRPQLVIRVAANRVEILEMQRWAAPLKSEIPRLIAENLAREIGTAQLSFYPQNGGENADYQVLVDVQRFDGTPGEAVTVDAAWSVRQSGGVTPRTGHSVIHEKAAGESYDVLVAAYGRAFAEVSREIAQAIRAEASTPQQRP